MPTKPQLPSQAEALEIVSAVLNQLQRQRVSIDGYKDTYAVAAMLDRVRAAEVMPQVEESASKYDQALAEFGRNALEVMGSGGDWSMDTLDAIAQDAYGRGLAREADCKLKVIPENKFKTGHGVRI